MRSGDAQGLELRRQRLLAGDEEAHPAADAVHERAQERRAHAGHATVVMRLERAQPHDGVGLRVRDPEIATDRDIGAEAVGVQVEERMVRGVEQVTASPALPGERGGRHDRGRQRIGQPPEKRHRRGVVVVEDRRPAPQQERGARRVHAGAGDQVGPEPPRQGQQPCFPDQQLAEPSALIPRRGREHAMGDPVGVEEGKGDVLVARHDQRLVAPRVEGGDHVAEHVGQRGVADVDQDSHLFGS